MKKAASERKSKADAEKRDAEEKAREAAETAGPVILKPHANDENIKLAFGDNPPELKPGQMYYVEESANVLGVTKGKVVLFDRDRYCYYDFVGGGGSEGLKALRGIKNGISKAYVFPFDRLLSKGVATNVYFPEDFEGPFTNSTAAFWSLGSNNSVGLSGRTKAPVTSQSTEVQSMLLGGISITELYYTARSDEWIYDEAPITWVMPTFPFTMPSKMVA